MESLDLDIDNYNLNDILNLFNISCTFDESDLKTCKKMVLKTHPDKSSLDKKYFLFFSKAYKILYNIYIFKSKKNTCPTEYKDILNEDDDQAKQELIDKFTNNKQFLKNFNEAFEKNNITNGFVDHGYKDWLATGDFIILDKKSGRNKAIEEYKQRQLIKKEGIKDISISNYSDIDGSKPENYGSSIFSTLQYDDIKKAHSESIIPVSERDMPIKQYNSVDELANARSTQQILMPSLEQSNKLLNKQNKQQDELATIRAYNLARESLNADNSNREFNKMFHQLNYKNNYI